MAAASKKVVQEFVDTWRDRGDEKQDSQAFWTDFLVRCLGVIPETIPSFARFERPVKGKTPAGKTNTRYIDVLIPDHRVLDAAVEAAYGVNFGGDEEKIVVHLFELYADKTGVDNE